MDLSTAIAELKYVLDANRRADHWTWHLRQQLAQVREALAGDRVRNVDGWLSARASATDRTRRQLMGRISVMLARDMLDADHVFLPASRLLQDLEHFRQRMQDLAYDSVALEIGGSE